MSAWTLAIDLGTSNTAAAIRRGTGPAESVRLTPSADTMPSAVLRGAQGYRVGTAARHGQIANPAGFLECPKAELGRGAVMLGDDEVEATEVVAQVLRTAADKAVQVAGGSPPEAVVLTHPQEWAARRLDALRAAWLQALPGVTDIRLVPEPVAAVAWFSHAAAIPAGGAVAVFDYGGGTCDVAVLRRSSEDVADGVWPFQVVAHAGRDHLGGNALDQLLLTHVRAELARRGQHALLAALDDPGQHAALRTLRDQVRSAKEMLSDYEDAEVAVAAGEHQTSVLVTRAEFDAVVADEVQAARTLVADTLRSASIDPSDLHALYLTGGSSHVPAVHEAMADLLGGRPATLGDPKLVVALGAHYVPTGAAAAPRPAAGPAPTGSPPERPADRSAPKPRRRPRPAPRTRSKSAGPAETRAAERFLIDPDSRASDAGHVGTRFLCADHEGQPAKLTDIKKPGEPVAEGELLAVLKGSGWQVAYTSPVTGFVRRASGHDRFNALSPLVIGPTIAEVAHRSFTFPRSATPQGHLAWDFLRDLGCDEDAGRCLATLHRSAQRRGSMEFLGTAYWATPAEPRLRSGSVLGWPGGSRRLAGKERTAPPFIVLSWSNWLPGDPAPVVLTPDNVNGIAEHRRGRSWGMYALAAVMGDGMIRERHLLVTCLTEPGQVQLQSYEDLRQPLLRFLGSGS